MTNMSKKEFKEIFREGQDIEFSYPGNYYALNVGDDYVYVNKINPEDMEVITWWEFKNKSKRKSLLTAFLDEPMFDGKTFREIEKTVRIEFHS